MRAALPSASARDRGCSTGLARGQRRLDLESGIARVARRRDIVFLQAALSRLRECGFRRRAGQTPIRAREGGSRRSRRRACPPRRRRPSPACPRERSRRTRCRCVCPWVFRGPAPGSCSRVPRTVPFLVRLAGRLVGRAVESIVAVGGCLRPRPKSRTLTTSGVTLMLPASGRGERFRSCAASSAPATSGRRAEPASSGRGRSARPRRALSLRRAPGRGNARRSPLRSRGFSRSRGGPGPPAAWRSSRSNRAKCSAIRASESGRTLSATSVRAGGPAPSDLPFLQRRAARESRGRTPRAGRERHLTPDLISARSGRPACPPPRIVISFKPAIDVRIRHHRLRARRSCTTYRCADDGAMRKRSWKVSRCVPADTRSIRGNRRSRPRCRRACRPRKHAPRPVRRPS